MPVPTLPEEQDQARFQKPSHISLPSLRDSTSSNPWPDVDGNLRGMETVLIGRSWPRKPNRNQVAKRGLTRDLSSLQSRSMRRAMSSSPAFNPSGSRGSDGVAPLVLSLSWTAFETPVLLSGSCTSDQIPFHADKGSAGIVQRPGPGGIRKRLMRRATQTRSR